MARDEGPQASAQIKPLHPFFASGRPSTKDNCKDLEPSATRNESSLPSIPLPCNRQPSESNESSKDRRMTCKTCKACKTNKTIKKRRKLDEDRDDEEQRRKIKVKKKARTSLGVNIAEQSAKLNAETGPMKAGEDDCTDGLRRCSAQLGRQEDNKTGLDAFFPAQKGDDRNLKRTHDGTWADKTPGTLPPPPDAPIPTDSVSNPTRLLCLNSETGTIGSPPKPTVVEADKDKIVGKRNRQKANNNKSRIVSITYGTSAETRAHIGNRIYSVLDLQFSCPQKAASSSSAGARASTKSSFSSPEMNKTNNATACRQATQTTQAIAKSTHPFFLGKAKGSDVPLGALGESKDAKSESLKLAPRVKQFTTTPCSPVKTRRPGQIFTMRQLGNSMGHKLPGSKHPEWPWRDAMHVRGDGCEVQPIEDISLWPPLRKCKGQAIEVSLQESCFGNFTKWLDVRKIVDMVRNVDGDKFQPPPPELRLPQKHIESGCKLQIRILPELRTLQDRMACKQNKGRKRVLSEEPAIPQIAPSLARLFESIRGGLSAFDKNQCEVSSWTQKYAPMTAVEVLQPGQEAFLMRDWLQALTIQAVDSGRGDSEKSSAETKPKGGRVKKRKQNDKLEGFVVSSDDEDEKLEELSEDESQWSPSSCNGSQKKSVVKAGNRGAMGKDGGRLTNALLISGPYGCGKTTLVYAVAKELGFEVFEINPSSRRSGKDILEKIGDMTRNHLVQHHPSVHGESEAATDNVGDETAMEIKSGKQAILKTFFKPKQPSTKASQPIPSQGKKQKEVTESRKAQEGPKNTAKTQKQSLILLEEVDILYEEDKQFWAYVMNLMAQSRRPFIMTCNDERLVPLQSLNLHGIFRLVRPPEDLAVDRLLLIAANEGHALGRQAVEALYESSNQDMRAATTALQYWCQIGVGDRKGGFDWFYPRWPKGTDLDDSGEIVRVVSHNSFLPGMDLLGRDLLMEADVCPMAVEDDILLQACDHWKLDMRHCLESVDWVDEGKPSTTTSEERLAALEAYDTFTDGVSVADMCSYRSFAKLDEEHIDATQPAPSAKAQEDSIIGLISLNTPTVTDYSNLATAIPLAIHSLTRTRVGSFVMAPRDRPMSQIRPLDESRAIGCIRRNISLSRPDAPVVDRYDVARAFDPLAESDASHGRQASYLEASVFDRTMQLIMLDVAPYVRTMVAFETRLQKQRLAMSSLISRGGQPRKRIRTTKAALSALEGGSRSTVRREKWFKADINSHLVMQTGGDGWQEIGE